MGRVFRLHHRVACHPAELGAFHVVHALVGGTCEDDDVEHGRAEEDQRPALCRRLVEIEHRHRRHGLVAMQPANLAPVEKSTDRDEHQTGDEYHRQNQVGQDPDIRTTFEPELLHRKQASHQHQARHGECGADEADYVLSNGCKKVFEHGNPRVRRWPALFRHSISG